MIKNIFQNYLVEERKQGFATNISSHFLLRTLVHKKLAKLEGGYLMLKDPYGVSYFGDKKAAKGKMLAIHIKDAEFYPLLAFKGALGASEAYIKGVWDVNDLYGLMRFLSMNEKTLVALDKGLSSLKNVSSFFYHFLKRNSVLGAKKNIKAHYDLSNEMFSQFLDPRMMYSSAFYASKDKTLEEASLAKLDRICRKLGLKKEDKVVEIGSGWGGFAIFAAQKYGCHVTTTTISDDQYQYAKKKIKELNLDSHITLLKKDYRELQGSFDKLVSIEMIEAVGASYLPSYIKKCSDLLKEDGSMLLQAITINDQDYLRALREVDFIKKYIFPGSFIPSIHAIGQAVLSHSDLRMYHLEDMTSHYERTLLDWQERFNKNYAKIEKLGFDNTFKRMWNYYFSYCAGGFAERKIGSVQILYGKRGYRDDLSLQMTCHEHSY